MSTSAALTPVTGGSSGIGLAVAHYLVQLGAHVTIVARSKDRLIKALNELKDKAADGQKVNFLSVDLSGEYADVVAKVSECRNEAGPILGLFNCAGTSIAGRFERLDIKEFKKMMSMNYETAVHATRAVIPDMFEFEEGRIVFVLSQAGQLGLFGYSAYAASKFALRGLAESLQMEVAPFNIAVTLSFPADTDTPGFTEEQKHKPVETRLISDMAVLYSPAEVARRIVNDSMNGKFFSSVGLDGWMLANLTAGFSPIRHWLDGIIQALTMGPFRLVALHYLRGFANIVQVCHERELDPDATLAETETKD